MTHSILWRGIHLGGHEACRLFRRGQEWRLEGTAVFAHDQRPCKLSYLVTCDTQWNTQIAVVSGWVGDDDVDIELTVDADQNWAVNGLNNPAVQGCIDVDLNFSPSTNLLPIRRLNLGVGQQAEVKAAWLRFPGFELEPLVQVYQRVNEFCYRYESGGGTFTADLTVNEVGFVRNYPGIWTSEP